MNESSVYSKQNVEERLAQLHSRAEADIETIVIDPENVPRSLDENRKLMGTKPKSWTSGFYPGTIWQLNNFSSSKALERAGKQWLDVIENQKLDSTTHDVGFKIYCSFGNAMRTKNSKRFQDVIVQAAQTLCTRFSPTVGALRSWDHHAEEWDYPVIIDNMMNLELLFEATRMTGDSMYHHIADAHATTTLKNHFREDHSSYHVIGYNPESGEVEHKHTHQGAGHETAWSRGQAWGLYGFTMAYRYTRNPAYLDKAVSIAEFMFTHENLPSDGVPYWDYNAPEIPDTYRDVSAAAIAASGLLELSTYPTGQSDQHLAWADKILTSLTAPEYNTSEAPFFLDHSVGSVPGDFEIDVPIVYADYYYVEALMRRRQLFNQ